LTENIAYAENNCWYSPESKNYMVRGKSYLADGIKVPAQSNLGKLVGVDWFIHSERIDNVCSHTCTNELVFLSVYLVKAFHSIIHRRSCMPGLIINLYLR